MKFLYEDAQIIVCYKEAGLPVQSARVGRADMVSILKNHLWQQNPGKGEPYLGVIHRLDQPVEGVLAFARTPLAARELSAQVTDGRMEKIYHAVVHTSDGQAPKEGRLVDYLLKEAGSNSSRVVQEHTRGAKKAELYYKILKRNEKAGKDISEKKEEDAALTEIHLYTGRHHQIRVQMAHAGMPLYGDRKYGEKGDEEGKTLALCAVSLELFHPKTGKKMKFSCEPLGEYFRLF